MAKSPGRQFSGIVDKILENGVPSRIGTTGSLEYYKRVEANGIVFMCGRIALFEVPHVNMPKSWAVVLPLGMLAVVNERPAPENKDASEKAPSFDTILRTRTFTPCDDVCPEAKAINTHKTAKLLDPSESLMVLNWLGGNPDIKNSSSLDYIFSTLSLEEQKICAHAQEVALLDDTQFTAAHHPHAHQPDIRFCFSPQNPVSR
jgi:hypothetical protein